MAKRKTTTKKKVVRKRAVKKKAAPKRKTVKRAKRSTSKPKDKQPEFMVQVNDPMMLRKDILESLREVIIFRS